MGAEGESRHVLRLSGIKLQKPTKRLVLNQKGLKINAAKLAGKRKNIDYDFKIIRINHLPTKEELRIHTLEPLYSGRYSLTLAFWSGAAPEQYEWLTSALPEQLQARPLRTLMPLIDEAQARKKADFKIVQADGKRPV